MSTQDVSRLDSYRDRRVRRRTQAEALYCGDPARAALVRCLSRILEGGAGDRAAVLWVDEYGPTCAHVYCLLDLSADEPRRLFDVAPLREAWNRGVPGLTDVSQVVSGTFSGAGPIRSAMTVALGSDGTRAWFLALDSLTPRGPLAGEHLDPFMFEAGRIASLVLHRNIDGSGRVHGEQAGASTFAGWAILKDIEGRERDDSAGQRIATRFLIARLVQSVVDSDFQTDESALQEQISSARHELSVVATGDPERRSWERVLDGMEAGDRTELAAAVLELADRVSVQGHLEGARELYRSCYLIAIGAGLPDSAIDAARFQGRVHRQLAQWDDSFRWYGIAQEMAAAYGRLGKLAVVLDGLGQSHRHRGDLEAAVELHRKTVSIGEELDDRTVQGLGWHSLSVDMIELGRFVESIENAWRAFEVYESRRQRIRVLTNIAWGFVELGDLGSAENAYRIVLAETTDHEHRVYTLDALAYIRALRGDEAGFERSLEAVDATAWREGPANMVAELMFYRGKGYALLDAEAQAQHWLAAAEEYASEMELERVLDQVRSTRRAMESGELAPEGKGGGRKAPLTHPKRLERIRLELGAMCVRATESLA